MCGVGGAGGCFTPGLFKETAQGMPLALLTKHFFFFFFCLFVFFFFHFFFFSCVFLGALQSNPLGPSLPPQPFEDASETFSRRHRGLFSVPMFQMNNPTLLRPCRGVTRGVGIDGGGLMSDFAAEGASLHSS